MPSRLAKERVVSDALLVRRTPLRESDLIATFFTEEVGIVSAVARGALKSRRRFPALEPMHRLRVQFDLVRGRDLGTLIEAQLVGARMGITTRLDAMEAAGQGLRWVRQAGAPLSPEAGMWAEINHLLDALDAGGGEALRLLAAAGLQLLVMAGWGLELDACVRCGRPCPPNARTTIDVAAGGVVCRTCGGHGRTTSSAQRAALLAAMRGESFDGDAAAAVDLVEQALGIHGRGEGT